jgi:Flp pilus assembly protein TadG
MLRSRIRLNVRAKARAGASMLEFALVFPLFLAAILGILEFGRAFMVNQVMISASRAGVRKAIIAGTDEAVVKQAIEDEITANLTTVKTSDVVITYLVDGEKGTFTGANRGAQIAVRVQIPFASVAVASPMFMGNATLTGECVMRRE